MIILAYPKFRFCEIKTRLVNDPKIALISILNYNDTESIIEDIPGKSITLFFDDIGPDRENAPECIRDIYDELTLFNEDHARNIIEFQKTIDENTITSIIVHCTAGISRSGAVSQFLQDIYHKNDKDNEIFNRNNRHIVPNKHVYKTLRDIMFKEYRSEQT